MFPFQPRLQPKATPHSKAPGIIPCHIHRRATVIPMSVCTSKWVVIVFPRVLPTNGKMPRIKQFVHLIGHRPTVQPKRFHKTLLSYFLWRVGTIMAITSRYVQQAFHQLRSNLLRVRPSVSGTYRGEFLLESGHQVSSFWHARQPLP